MKRLLSAILCMALLLTLCACGKKEETSAGSSERPKLEISGTTQSITESTTQAAPETPNSESEALTESFVPIVLYDDEYCTIKQTTDAYYDHPSTYIDIEIINKTAGILSYEVGFRYYVNNVRTSSYDHKRWGEVYANETVTNPIYVSEEIEDLAGKRIDISVCIAYNNGQSGVYAEQFGVVDKVFNLYAPASNPSDKYTETGNELAVIDNGVFKLIATNYVASSENPEYEMTIYLENKSDNCLTFNFSSIFLSSNIQENQQELNLYSSSWRSDCAWTSGGPTLFTLEPGMGHYFTLGISKSTIDNFAIDVNEIVSINIPLQAENIIQDMDSNLDDMFHQEANQVVEDVLTFTRAQLVS